MKVEQQYERFDQFGKELTNFGSDLMTWSREYLACFLTFGVIIFILFINHDDVLFHGILDCVERIYLTKRK